MQLCNDNRNEVQAACGSPLPLSRVTGLLEWQIALASLALPHMAYVRSARLAVCRWQMVACRPCQLASLDGQLNLLQAPRHLNAAGQWGRLNQWWLSHCKLPCWLGLQRSHLNQNLSHLKNVFGRSNVLHESRTSHGHCFEILIVGLDITWSMAQQVQLTLALQRKTCRPANLGKILYFDYPNSMPLSSHAFAPP